MTAFQSLAVGMLVFLGSHAPPVSTSAPAQVCLTDAASSRLIALIREDIDEPEFLTLIGSGPIADSTVTLVNNETTCALARDAFSATRQAEWGTPAPESVYVIMVGSSRYAVIDPLVGSNTHNTVFAIFDQNWQLLVHYIG